MYQIAQAVLWGWIPLVLGLFLVMPHRRAVVVALIGSWLFLPQLAYSVPLMPDFTKVTATSSWRLRKRFRRSSSWAR